MDPSTSYPSHLYKTSTITHTSMKGMTSPYTSIRRTSTSSASNMASTNTTTPWENSNFHVPYGWRKWKGFNNCKFTGAKQARRYCNMFICLYPRYFECMVRGNMIKYSKSQLPIFTTLTPILPQLWIPSQKNRTAQTWDWSLWINCDSTINLGSKQ